MGREGDPPHYHDMAVGDTKSGAPWHGTDSSSASCCQLSNRDMDGTGYKYYNVQESAVINLIGK